MKNAMLLAMLPAVLSILPLLPTTASARGLDLVRDGQPRAEIVVARDAHNGVQLAAQDLQGYLEKISGARLNIVHAPSGATLHPIFVGESEHTAKLGYRLPEFKGSGYEILVAQDYVVLAGADQFYPPLEYSAESLAAFREVFGPSYSPGRGSNGGDGFIDALGIFVGDDVGAWHAVSALLERLGVRFYAPYTEDGTLVPERRDIVLTEGRETRTAAFERRVWCHFDRSDKEGNLWLRRLKVGSHVGAWINHTMYSFLGTNLMAEHPEWFARDREGRFIPIVKGSAGAIPRYTHPEFIQACTRWAQITFDAAPSLRQLTVGAPDESKDEDAGYPLDYQEERAYRKEGMSRQQAYVDILWDLQVAIAKELKKTHPDRYLVWWTVYADLLPTNIDPANTPDNLLVRMEALSPGNAYVVDTVLQQYRQRTREKFAAFKPSGKSQQWEWWMDYWHKESPRYPEFFMRRLQEVRQDQVNYFNGFFMETVPLKPDKDGIRRQDEMPIRHLMMYINSQLMWNPQLDLDALLDEYYALWFGPAREEMKAFHNRAEEIWMRQGSRSVSRVDGFLKPEDLDTYFSLLDAARAKTAEGTVYRKHVDDLLEGYAGLKTVFADRFPTGPFLRTQALDDHAAADGDFSKYAGDWVVLKTRDGQDVEASNQTRFNVGVTRNKQKVLVAMKLCEENPDAIKANTQTPDRSSILQDDHVRVDLNTPLRSWFTIASNLRGIPFDKATDLELMNQYALHEFWTPGVTVHVEKTDQGWDIEMAIPTTDFGAVGPSEDQPWGINVIRVRHPGGQREEQSLAAEIPSSWFRLVSE